MITRGVRKLRWKIIDIEFAIHIQDDHRFDEIAKLTNIAGPIIGVKFLGYRRGEIAGGMIMPAYESLAEMIHQRNDVVSSIPQRRQMYRYDFEPIKQIVSELSIFNHRLQRTIRCGDQANVYLDRLVVADSCDLVLFQYPKQLNLGAHRHIAYFIQEQRTAIGILKSSFSICDCIGERATDVTEHLAFHQILGYGPNIEGHHSLGFARAVLMDSSCNQLFSGSALTCDQNGCIRGCNSF